MRGYTEQEVHPQIARPILRAERTADQSGIRKVLKAAFGRSAEADLVEVLRGRNAIIGSWVAVVEDEVVGCLVFTPIRLEPPLGQTPIVGLAPVAVRPDFQRHGIGTSLIGHSLRQVKGLGLAAVVVLGDPSFYRRFGFHPASDFGMDCDFTAPHGAFMAMELLPKALQGYHGRAHFHHAFDSLV
jgi:putative acetyltransferase